MELEKPGPIDHDRIANLVIEANSHSKAVHGHDGPEPDCEECVRLANEMMAATGLTKKHMEFARREGLAPPPGISPIIDKILEEEDDPWM